MVPETLKPAHTLDWKNIQVLKNFILCKISYKDQYLHVKNAFVQSDVFPSGACPLRCL